MDRRARLRASIDGGEGATERRVGAIAYQGTCHQHVLCLGGTHA